MSPKTGAVGAALAGARSIGAGACRARAVSEAEGRDRGAAEVRYHLTFEVQAGGDPGADPFDPRGQRSLDPGERLRRLRLAPEPQPGAVGARQGYGLKTFQVIILDFSKPLIRFCFY